MRATIFGAVLLASTALAAAQQGFEPSYTAGTLDAAGRFMGGTELRILVGHAGKLYAGNGYWKDQFEDEGPQNAEILVLDKPDGRWRVDHSFDGQTLNGRPRNLAVATLAEAKFATDANGAPLAAPVSMLVASTWDLTGRQMVYSRDDSTGAWSAATLVGDRGIIRGLAQVRAFGQHRDRVTGVDILFAGDNPHGIFTGVYDPGAPGRIRWSRTPEFTPEPIPEGEFPGLRDLPRVSSFAECNGRLYAAIGQQIYERADGAQPSWRLVYTNPKPGHSQTGLRGLTAIPDAAGGGEVLLAAVEGSEPRIVRIDPRSGAEATELDLKSLLRQEWGADVDYMIAAYNGMTKIHDRQGENVLLIGIEATLAVGSPVPAGHGAVGRGRARHESGAWYLIRRANGRYDLRQIPSPSGQPLVSTRTIVASPFRNDGDAIYFGGYDTNYRPVHNTAWVVRASIAAAVGP